MLTDYDVQEAYELLMSRNLSVHDVLRLLIRVMEAMPKAQ